MSLEDSRGKVLIVKVYFIKESRKGFLGIPAATNSEGSRNQWVASSRIGERANDRQIPLSQGKVRDIVRPSYVIRPPRVRSCDVIPVSRGEILQQCSGI